MSSDKTETTKNDPSSSHPSANSRIQFPNWMKIALLAGLVAVASVSYFASKWTAKPSSPALGEAELDPEELAKRKKVQDFILTDADGQQKKLSDFRGNVVILSFWASWCTPCLVELPTFAEIESKFRDQGLTILAVNVDEGDEGKTFAKDFWAKNRLPFPTYFDTTKAIAHQFDVENLPSNFVIDRQGRLVFSSFGANDWSSGETAEILGGLLQESEQDPVAPPTESEP